MYSPQYGLVLHPRMPTLAVSCMSCGAAMHTGKHEQMPLAFLVLHAILGYHLDLSKVFAHCPCWPFSCLLVSPGQDSQLTPYQERDLLVRVEC